MEEDKKTAWWRYVLAVLAYLALALFGGSLIMIINAFSPRAGRYVPGDLGYTVLQIATGPVGIVLANVAYMKIMNEKHPVLLVVLNTVMATVFLGVCVFNLVVGAPFTKDFLTVLLAGLTAAGAVAFVAAAMKGDKSGQDA